MRGDKAKGYLYLLPTILILIAVVIFPLIYALNLSFSRWDDFEQTITKFVGFKNYHRLLTRDNRFWNSLEKSFVLWGVAGSAQIVLGFLMALLLNRVFLFHRVVKALVLLPMLVLPVGAAHMWSLIFNPLFGPINYILSIVHLPQLDWLGSTRYAMISIIITDVWQWTPFCFLILFAGMQGIPMELYDAAKVDGASAWQTVRRITIPLLKRVFLVVILFRSIDLFRTFDTIYVLTSGGPAGATETMPFYTYILGFKRFDMDKAAALSFLLVIIVSLLSIFFIARFEKEE
jgi:multiple sugar transport system permease protein